MMTDKDIKEYLKEEVDPYLEGYEREAKEPLIGYQIDFIRYFYNFKNKRPFKEIEKELLEVNKQIHLGLDND